MPNNQNYHEVYPSADAHMIRDAPFNYNQQYNMSQEEYEAAVARHQHQEQREYQQQYLHVMQEHADANQYVQDLIEKTSKMSESGMEEEEYGEEE